MASFTEQATLKVNDQSSATLKKINAELKKLEATAKSLKSVTIKITVNDKAIQSAIRNARSLKREVDRLGGHGGNTRLNVQVNTHGLTQAQRQIQQMRAAAARPITVNMRAAGAGGGAGGRGAGAGGGPNRRGLRQTGIQHQLGNFSVARGAASVVIGGTAYAIAANVMKTALEGVVGSEDARMRLQQSGFTPAQTDLFMAMARKTQEEYSRIPAAAIANASVEQLQAIKAFNGSFADYQQALNRVARNAQIMAITFKDPHEGAEASRQLERVSQIMGKDVDDKEIRKVQEATMRAIIASGGEMKAAEAVRALQQMGSSIVKSMSPQALTDLLMVRDEGGKQSTAEWRMAIQDLMRGSLDPDDKERMAKHGLRKKSGSADPAVVKEAASDLVGFTEKRLVPIITKAGLAAASSAEIATYLDEIVGYGTSSARAYADIITSLRDGELQRQRAAARAVNLDPNLGDRTFRGGAETLKASFETMLARALDKTGGAFADAAKPFALNMDRAGKAAEKGDYGTVALEMSKAVLSIMGGPVGAIITAKTAIDAFKVLLDPKATPIEKGAAMLVTGSSALLTAAGLMVKYFGGGDPKEDLAHQKALETTLPTEIENYKNQIAALEAKPNKSVAERQRLADLNRVLTTAENSLRDVQRNIITAQARVDAANEEAARVKAEEAAEMDRLQRESGLGTGAATTATGVKPPIPDEALKKLQQLGTTGGLAGVKSIVNLLKALDQPTSIKSREALATSLGYTGPLGGSAAMNTFLLNFFKKLATAIPDPATTPPAAVLPPEPPPAWRKPPETLQPQVPPKVEIEPPPRVEWEVPPELRKVEVPQPLQVIPAPAAPPTVPVVPPGGAPGTFPGPGKPFTPISFTDVVDPTTIPSAFDATFSTGATTLGKSGTTIGSNAASAIQAQAGAIGGAIGAAFAAKASGVSIDVNVPNVQSASSRGSPGTQAGMET